MSLLLLGAGPATPATSPPFNPATSLPGAVAVWQFSEAVGPQINNDVYAKGNGNPNNIFAASEQMKLCGEWNNGGAGLTDQYALAPDSTMNATRLVLGTGNNNLSRPMIGLSSAQRTLSVWVRYNSNVVAVNQTFRLALSSSNISTILTATSTWQLFTFTATNAPNNAGFFTDGTNATDLQIWGMMVEPGAVASNYVPAQYNLVIDNALTPPVWTSRGLTFSSSNLGPLGLGPQSAWSKFTVHTLVKQTALASATFHICSDNFTSHFSGEAGLSGSLIGSNSNGGQISSTHVLGNVGGIDGGYHLVTRVYDGTTMYVYWDGCLVGANPPNAPVSSFSWTAGFWCVGAIGGAFIGDPFIGEMSFSAVYSTNHSQDQVNQMHQYLSTQMQPRGVTLTYPSNIFVCEGDSITYGFGASSSYSLLTWAAVSPNTVAYVMAVVSSVLAGNATSNSVQARLPLALQAIKYTQPTRNNIYSLMIGKNDGNAYLTAVSRASYLATIKSFALQLRAAGYRFLYICNTSTNASGTFDSNRDLFISLICADSNSPQWYDAIARFDLIPKIGPDNSAQSDNVGPGEGPTGSITNATNANPIVITSTAHGLATGNTIIITGVGGNTAANTTKAITVIDANTFSIAVTGNGAYTSGGTWSQLDYYFQDGLHMTNVGAGLASTDANNGLQVILAAVLGPGINWNGPTNGAAATASGQFWLFCNALTAPTTITLSDGGAGGTFSTGTTISAPAGNSIQNFTYTPAQLGTTTLTISNSNSYAQGPASWAYAVYPAVRGTPTTGTMTGTATVPLPTFNPGDTLVVSVNAKIASAGVAPSSPTSGSGGTWTALTPQTGTLGDAQLSVWSKTAQAGDTFVSATNVTLGVYNAYAINQSKNTVDVSASNTGTNATISPPQVTPSGIGRLMLQIIAAYGTSSSSVTPNASLTTSTTSTGNGNVSIASGTVPMSCQSLSTLYPSAGSSGVIESTAFTIALE